jgi:hypothetical protein
MNDFKFNSWFDFKNEIFPTLCGTGEPQMSRFLFRGQRDPDWKLVPSFYRHFNFESERIRVMALNSLMSQFEKHCQADESLKSIFEKNSSQRMAFA